MRKAMDLVASCGTELVIDRKNGNRVFRFDGALREQVWEPMPVTRFRFKKSVESDWLKEQLAANYPRVGIVFKGMPYIGTSDGYVCTPTKKIQRIPEIFVDEDLFIEEYPFKDDERAAYEVYKKGGGLEKLVLLGNSLVDKVLAIEELRLNVDLQNRNLDRYLAPPEHGIARLAIQGFVVQKTGQSEEKLYDGHILGITETETGIVINDLIPHALYQLSPTSAGFVPSGYPPRALERIVIEKGFEKRVPVYCVDYRSLWSLNGQGIFVRDICPRDGSGYAPAKFATDGETVAISHGNHPCYKLDILKQDGPGRVQVKIKSVNIDPEKIPQRLWIRNEEVYGDYGNAVLNFSKTETVFAPRAGEITSFSDSGNCTVQVEDRTMFYNPFTSQPFAELNGEYEYLPANRQ